MRRIIVIFLISILSCSLLFSEEKPKNNDDSVVLYGTMRTFTKLSITEIDSSGTSTSGMPFNITGDDVRFNSIYANEGRRQIATWSLSTNQLEYQGSDYRITKLGISITAAPLTCGNTSVDYYLYFRIDPSNGVIGLTSNCIKVGSTGLNLNQPSAIPLITNRTAIVSNEQPIRFMLAEYSDAEIAQWAYGAYSATVTVNLTQLD